MKVLTFQIVLCAISLSVAGGQTQDPSLTAATYSIVGWDSLTGDLGIAVKSKVLAAGGLVPYAKAGMGAIATQGSINPAYGAQGLDLLEQGKSAQQVVETLLRSDTGASRRQVAVVDAQGGAFAYTGSNCTQLSTHMTGRGYSAQASAAAGEYVVRSMTRTFEITPGDLTERLLSALEAGERSAGDRRGRQSAAILVVREGGGYAGFNDRMVDLRVDDDSVPLVQLRRLLGVWQRTILPDVQMRSVQMFNEKKNFVASQELAGRMVNALNAQLRDKPDDPDVLSAVARALATNNIDRQRALELAKRAAKLAPTKLPILDALAECHYQLGHFEEAIAIESELVAKDPSNDDYWKQLKRFKEGKERLTR